MRLSLNLVRLKRIVGNKNVSTLPSSVWDYRNKHVKARGNVDDHNSDFHPETRGERVFSAYTNLSVLFIQKPSTIQIVADTSTPTWNYVPSPSSISVRPQGHIVIHQHAVVAVF